ncbi:hypothetical protein [Anaerotignum sp. MB30-C6]|uniref:hypothetical protein n=1 Tax=Anaerotignum sp. MB30-C6 TaxID=3070814 RepID=UPI0027DE7C34|nr:hypothetical protein [Anaerotignum sp. MB30-C6]WMI81980.1 hypothetical protein RBQ60_04400 [Anaerotignum sp. MB30-C6]
MKRVFFYIFLVVITGFCGCTNKDENIEKINTKIEIDKSQWNVSPYELTDQEINLLQSLGLMNNYGLFSFRGPEGTKSMRFNLYQLDENNCWENKLTGGVLGEVQEDGRYTPPKGNFSVVRQNDYSLSFYINSTGIASFEAPPPEASPLNMASFIKFLPHEEAVNLNQEVPVALIVYDKDSFSFDYTLADYFTPENIKNKDIVLAVTLTFFDYED